MTTPPSLPQIDVRIDGAIATVEIQRPPHNFFDIPMISGIADAFEALEADPACRAIVLCAQGKSFCAGADFNNDGAPVQASARAMNPLYFEAIRLFACTKPVVGAIHGAAVGGGLGLAVMADFRVTCPGARFSANFNRLGFHPGFGLSVTLPRLVGAQQAALLFYTGRRIGGEEALRIGLADVLVPQDQVRTAARELAAEIAVSSPDAVQSTRATLRAGLVDAIRQAVARESIAQNRQFKMEDFREGVRAMTERRAPRFTGR
ncbi:MAG: enoyl-CoA hydratase/isomerase family protein [Ottowia sp.]|uniref:enoyl-CoA hydratase/isomerase family protein n=1 Tax=Ottowia sp. TaxID=1898956 RepID=UPI0039E4D4FF